MTPRAARLVAAAAVLAWCAAALSFLAPSLPAGLSAALGPGPVARELLALLAVLALLVVPSFTADEPGRPREDHAGLLAVLAGLPAVLALHRAGGGEGAALLPAAVLLLACDGAASSYLRLDPAGRRGTIFAAAAAALLAGIPVAAWGAAELGGWEGAAAGFRVSPLLAVRNPAGGWEGMAPAILVLLAAAALLRLGGLLARPAAAAPLLLLALGIPAAAEAAPAPPPGRGPVLVVGEVREGPVAELAAALRAAGLRSGVEETLPLPLPPEVEVILLGRPPRSEEAGPWRDGLRSFLRAGGRAAAAPGPAGDLLLAAAEPGTLGFAQVVEDRAAAGVAAVLLARPRTLLPHPAAGAEPGVAPEFFRVPFAVPPRSLPGRVLAFLGVLAAGFAAVALAARRRGASQARAGGALALLAATGSALLFLPGLAPGEAAVARLVLEERASASAPTARRLELVRVERVAAGEGTAAVDLDAGAWWTELLYEPGAAGTFEPPASVRLAGPGRWALLASVSGIDTLPPASPFLAALRVREGRAWAVPGGAVGDAPPGEGPGEPLEAALARWRRSEDPRVARAGRLLGAALRERGESFTLAVPAVGPDGVVFRE